MLGLRTTIYKVSDIQKATEWYSNAFETNPYYNEPYYVGFNIKGYELGLQPEDNPTFDKVESVTKKQNLQLLTNVKLFDVFESEKLGANKKSIAINFTFQNAEKTLTDKEIDETMNKLIKSFEKELHAEIRKN